MGCSNQHPQERGQQGGQLRHHLKGSIEALDLFGTFVRRLNLHTKLWKQQSVAEHLFGKSIVFASDVPLHELQYWQLKDPTSLDKASLARIGMLKADGKILAAM